MRTSIRVPATIEPLPGGEAIVAAPAAGRFTADALLSIGDRVRAGQVLGRLEPRLSARRRSRDARGRRRGSAGGARGRARRADARRTAAGRARGAGAARRRGAPRGRPSPRRGCRPPRRASRSATRRCAPAAARAAGNAFVLRAPIAGRVAEVMATLGASYDEGAPLFRIVRTDRVELEVQVPAADVAVGARRRRSSRSRSRAVPIRSRSTPHHMHDAGVHRSRRRRALPRAVRGRQSGRAAADRPDRHGHPLHAATPARAGGAEGGGADGSGPARTSSCRSAASASRGASSRSPRATAICVGVKSGVDAGDRVVTRGAYDVQLASAAKGLPAEGHVH